MSDNPYYTVAQHGEFDVYNLGDFVLEEGATLSNATIAYKTFGKLNEKGDNAILFTIMFSGSHAAMEPYIGEGLALDPTKYFIVLANQLGGGLSSSPHNTPEPYHGPAFPALTIGDDVRAQHKLLTEHLGVKHLQLVTGWSMGAQQTYEWAVRYSDMVKRAAPIAGTAQTTSHCALYVDVFCAALTSDPAWDNGNYKDASDVRQGLRRMARVFGLMGVYPEFYNNKFWADYGFSSKEDFMRRFWENWFLPMDPNILLSMAKKWRSGDVSRHTGGDLEAALARITAKVFVLAFEGDMFITPTDCTKEQQMIKESELIKIPSRFGHFSMFGVEPKDFEAVNNSFAKLLTITV